MSCLRHGFGQFATALVHFKTEFNKQTRNLFSKTQALGRQAPEFNLPARTKLLDEPSFRYNKSFRTEIGSKLNVFNR